MISLVSGVGSTTPSLRVGMYTTLCCGGGGAKGVSGGRDGVAGVMVVSKTLPSGGDGVSSCSVDSESGRKGKLNEFESFDYKVL